MPGPVHGALAQRHVAGDRDHVQGEAEQEDPQQPQKVGGDRDTEDRARHDEAIQARAAAQRRDHSRAHTHDEPQDRGTDRDRGGHREPGDHEVGHGRGQAEGVAQAGGRADHGAGALAEGTALNDAHEVVPELGVPGLVIAHELARPLEVVRGAGLAAGQPRRVGGPQGEDREGNEGDDDEDQERLDQTRGQEAQSVHRFSPVLGSRASRSPSPKRLKARVTRNRAAPGKSRYHGSGRTGRPRR